MSISIEEKRRILLHFDSLIRSKSKGNAKDMARRLGISKSTFFRLLDHLREELNAPVIYDEEICRYIYAKEGRIFLGFVEDETLKKNLQEKEK